MDIIIQSVGFKASNNLESFVHERLAKLANMSDRIIRANVTFYEGSTSNPDNNYCEIRLEVPGNDHFVKKNSDLYEKALVDAVEALQKMMQKNKDKSISKRHAD
ncbi:MAG: HPF/RaiA family ribosome-associated protein [Williamsia sp.]|nr:HPF/RaiA family ribosome-associated protein [Williamsia sp.]